MSEWRMMLTEKTGFGSQSGLCWKEGKVKIEENRRDGSAA